MICACIGVPAVKDNYLAGETEVRSTLLKMEIIRHITKLYSEGYDTFMCGCYPGVPLWTGESIISLRRDFPGFDDMKLYCCMPYDGFIGDLPPTFENRCRNVADKADKVIYVGDEFHPDCLRDADKYMSQIADCVFLASFRKNFAGTMKPDQPHIFKRLVWLNAGSYVTKEGFF